MSNIVGRMSLVGATIGGRGPSATTKPRITFKHYPASKKHVKSYNIFPHWVKHYSPPWLFFIEFAVLILFFVLAFSVQATTIPFFQDFGAAIDDYFLQGHEISEDEQDDSYGDRRIYTKPTFMDVIEETVYRFFQFSSNFPCSYQINQTTNLSLQITIKSQKELFFSFTKDQINQAVKTIEKYIDDFSRVQIKMTFQIISDKLNGQILDTGVISTFDNYQGTGIILWKSGHERSTQQISSQISNLEHNLSNTLSIVIIIFLVFGIIFQSMALGSLYQYSKAKAKVERTKPSTVFKQKLDPWEPTTLVLNILSCLSMIVYIFFGQSVNETLPWPHFLVAFASFIHAFILFRYLILRPSTLIVVRMLKNASLTLVQFVVGCSPFFAAFLVFGVCWFGWYSPLMSSSRQAAKILIASSYGDYLLDGYDDLVDYGDKPAIIPSTYFTIWIFNGLGIWFYVVLATLHAALIKEVHIARDEEIEAGYVDEDQIDAEDPLPWLQYYFEHK